MSYDLPSAAEIKRLAAACRKNGVKTIRIKDLELTLTDVPPPKQTRRRGKAAAQQAGSANEAVETEDMPTKDQLMYWSLPDTTFEDSQ